MFDIVGWLLRNWEPARRARCTACGRRAKGMLINRDEHPAIICEHCGKRWNITPLWGDEDDPYARD